MNTAPHWSEGLDVELRKDIIMNQYIEGEIKLSEAIRRITPLIDLKHLSSNIYIMMMARDSYEDAIREAFKRDYENLQ